MTTAEDIEKEARFIVDNNSTIRKAAQNFGISKTTMHTHVTKKLKQLDLELYKEVRVVLEQNWAERHIRGGMATKEKFKKLREN